MTADELAGAARNLLGVPFRLHGRDPASGLDCIGLLAATMEACGKRPDLPTGYSMRTRRFDALPQIARDIGFLPASGTPVCGDVVLARIGPCQMHLLIAISEAQFVHAHAGLKRVIASALPETAQIVSHWRLAATR